MTVTNPYYEFDPFFVPNTKARSDAVNIQYQAIQNAFDLLPGDSDALTTDTATFAPESGSGNAYVVTMPDTRTVNQDGDAVRFFATHTNTGPSTLDVDSIGPIALVNWTGTVLAGGEIVSGQIYEIRYDAINAQFVISASTDAAIQVAFAEEWAIKAEDVPVSTGAGGNGTTDFSSFHWAQKSLLSATTGRVNTDIVTATPPTTEAVTGAFEIYDGIAEDNDLLSRLGFQASNTLVLRNLMHGGAFQLSVETAAGVEVPYKFSDTRIAIPNAVGVTFDDSGAVERESLILEPGSSGDADFAQVEYLSNGDGADGATVFTEQSLNAASATFVDNAQLDTAQFKFGTASFLFDGTGDYVTFPDIAAYNLGSSVFTVEGWVRFASLPAVGDEMTMVSQWSDSTSTDESFAISLIQDGGSHRIRFEADGVFEQGTIAAPNLNQWYHFAAQRSTGDRLDIWFDGALEFGANVFSGAIQDSTETMKLGVYDPGAGANAGFLDGWLDDVRLTIGVERYTSGGAITVPAAAFPITGVADEFKVGNAAIQTVILGSGGEAAKTIAAASGGLQVNNTLTGAGLERVLTDSDISTGGAAVVAQYRFSTSTTEADPGNGRFRFDNATPASVTELFISSTTDNNNDFDNMLGFLSAGDQIYIQQDNDAAKFILFDVTANVDNTGWFSIAGTTSASGTILDNNAKSHILLLFGGTGGGGGTVGRVLTDINTATPPTTEAVSGEFEIFDADETDQLMRLGYVASNELNLHNFMHGGELRLSGEDAAGTVKEFFLADPNSIVDITANTSLRLMIDAGNNAVVCTGGAGVDLYNNNIERFSVTTSGRVIVRSDTDTDAEVREVVFAHQDGTVRGSIGHLASDILAIRNEIHNGEINIVQEDGAGADVIAFSYDASSGQVELNGANVVRLGFSNGEQAMRAQVNSFLTLHNNNIEVLRTTTTALGGVTVHNLLTGSGAERVLTTSDQLAAFKETITSRSSTTTKTVDPDLSLAIGVGNWVIDWTISINEAAGASQGFKFDWRTTGGTSAEFKYHGYYRPNAVQLTSASHFDRGDAGNLDIVIGDSTERTMFGQIYLVVTVATTVELFWAQVVSNASATAVHPGSNMVARRIP